MKCSARQIDILKQFVRLESTTSANLSHVLKISEKTIRNEIKEINNECEGLILPIKGKGFTLKNKEKAHDLIMNGSDKKNMSRQMMIFKQLLLNGAGDYYQMADQYYISEATLDNDVQVLNEGILKPYQTCIMRKNNKLLLECDEELRRKIYTFYLMNEIENYNFNLTNYNWYFEYSDMEDLKTFVIAFIKKNQLYFSDIEIISFIIHLAILIDRVKSGNDLKSFANICLMDDSQIVNELCCSLEEHYDFHLVDQEKLYVASLLSARMNARISKESKVEEMIRFIDDVLNDVAAYYSVQLQDDILFKNNFHVHLLTLCDRAIQNRRISNPLIQEIKANFPLLYDISVFISIKIQNHFHIIMDEDEIGFITLHLMCFVKKVKIEQFRIAVVDPVGCRNTAYYRKCLETEFSHELMEVENFSLFELELVQAFAPSFIIATVQLKEEFEVPVLLCSPLFIEADIRKIRKCMDELKIKKRKSQLVRSQFDPNLFFVEIDIKDKKDLLHFMCSKLVEYGYCKESYEELILERERIAPTSFGNLFAIPHPVKKEALISGIAIAVLKHPINWSGQKVQLVFLFSLAQENENMMKLYESIVDMLDDVDKVKRLINMKCYEDFIKEFIEL
ncbi:PRD domain-containing protein [Clostridium sp. WB02_MRS01]|uniref:BglG family transcription antiterminator n=1 Tax=Clostridium sp. WB02_MRS01 TaxID=2605777 RepID=UPI0012B3CFE5|nr:PTS sugar transporter subunit IIA [Clostridium sp. WB02_MRS01]MSS11338.1 PRD domain-containing protein [Clostridium sp. WB02_MRS01]